ncbi:MAG: response regulator [Sphingobacteriaceae bacterium]|nr:MAG: response regulator [Sphingobacteriaceae bacterium]
MSQTIILIENDPSVAEVIDYILSEAGFKVLQTPAGSYREAIQAEQPGLILLDYFLSGSVSGAEICAELKSNFSTRHIPIVLVSGASGLEKIASDCHVDDILPKPFDISDLENIAYKWLKPTNKAVNS